MTTNLKWTEIQDCLEISGDDSANDRPDIESQVFHIKVDELMDLIIKKVIWAN